MHLPAFLRKLARDCGGATIVEYGLLASLVAGVILVLVQDIGAATSDSLTAASAGFENTG